MSNNINDLLKKLAKPKKVKKHKIRERHILKLPSLLGVTPPKTIKPKKHAIPLSSERLHWHIAVDLTGASRSKRQKLKISIPRGYRRPKLTEQQIEAWKNYGRGVFVGHLKPYVQLYDTDYLYGYAQHVVSNRRIYQKKYVQDARNYLMVHRRRGAPELTRQYFLIKYGTKKIFRLGDDLLYKQMQRDLRTTTSKADIRSLKKMMRERRMQLRGTWADYYWTKYKKERFEIKKRKDLLEDKDEAVVKLMRMEEKLQEYLSSDQGQYFYYLKKFIGERILPTEWGKVDAFFRSFYSKYDGVVPGYAIGRGRERHSYEKLVKWLIETGLEQPLHSTNLTHLKNPHFILTLKTQLAGKFSQEQIDAYIRDNLTNPENLSRSGLPDPLVDWHSLHGYFRETPSGMYFGQEYERKLTSALGNIETSAMKDYNVFIKTENAKRVKMERDYLSFITPRDITSHYGVVLDFKKQLRDQQKQQNKSKKKK